MIVCICGGSVRGQERRFLPRDPALFRLLDAKVDLAVLHADADEAASGFNIVYINEDSLLSKYQYFVENYLFQ